MEHRIVSKPAFTVVGMKYRGKNEHDEIPQLWGQFVPRIGEIQHRTPDPATYGVMFNYDEATGEFDCVAALTVSSASDLPEGMVSVEMPAAQYAVFTCTLPTLSATYRQIHPGWHSPNTSTPAHPSSSTMGKTLTRKTPTHR
jgi:AraC family transcriptional regulator